MSSTPTRSEAKRGLQYDKNQLDAMADQSTFELGDIELQSGKLLEKAFLAYKTYGTLNAAKSNVIVFTTPFGSVHSDMEWMIGADMALDPNKYFIVIPNMFGNGTSISPSNAPSAQGEERFPNITLYDNAIQQRRLLHEQFGIERVQLVVGWSMGGQQAFHWGALFPEMVERIVPICASAKTSGHNYVFLDSLKAALTADPAVCDGRFAGKPERGLRAVARAYAPWSVSPAFYRERVYEKLGFVTIDDFLVKTWDANMLRRDANNMMAMWWSWQYADISANDQYRGDLKKALGSIRARALVMPATTDCYFTLDDSRLEVMQMPNAELRPIPSVWGHRAGNPMQSPEDLAFLNSSIRELLSY
jgi:homoserine O-acetyltransferase/O-succinyltransferase